MFCTSLYDNNTHNGGKKQHLFPILQGNPCSSILIPMKRVLICCLIAISIVPAALPADPLYIGAVQWEMREEYVEDIELFQERLEAALADALNQREEETSSLVIFPEYTNVFTSLHPYHDIISSSVSLDEAWLRIQDQYGYSSIEELFISESEYGLSQTAFWKRMAQEYDSYILPGTLFIYDELLQKLVNRWILFSPSGTIIQYQDKVFCTPFEQQICGISSGSLDDSFVIAIEGKRIAVTICRDTFFSDWEERFGDIDLWVDIKANGIDFDQTERQRFLRAVPERIADTSTPYGLTLCLTGSFHSLYWEGLSSLIDTAGNPLRSAANYDSYDSFSYILP